MASAMLQVKHITAPCLSATAKRSRPHSTVVVASSSHSASFGNDGSSASRPRKGQGNEPRGNAYGVFQLDADLPCTNLYDVRDACEACSNARTAVERRQCFEVFGLDAQKVDRYYDKVVTMEKMIDQGDSVGQGLVTSGGAVMLYYLAWCILKV